MSTLRHRPGNVPSGIYCTELHQRHLAATNNELCRAIPDSSEMLHGVPVVRRAGNLLNAGLDDSSGNLCEVFAFFKNKGKCQVKTLRVSDAFLDGRICKIDSFFLI